MKPKRKSPHAKAKSAIGKQARNRYYKGAKLSEYRFLKVLRAFADGLTVEEAADATALSTKSIRDLNRRFRERLIAAVILVPERFGQTGRFLFEGDELSERGKAILETAAGQESLSVFLKRHVRGMGASPDFPFLTFEYVTRMFCRAAMRNQIESLYPPEIQQAIDDLFDTAALIEANKEAATDDPWFRNIVAAFNGFLVNFPALLDKEEMRIMGMEAERHHYAQDVLYEDLRRYLMKAPL